MRIHFSVAAKSLKHEEDDAQRGTRKKFKEKSIEIRDPLEFKDKFSLKLKSAVKRPTKQQIIFKCKMSKSFSTTQNTQTTTQKGAGTFKL